jgi:uncharacterized protein (DUF433 family)
MASGRDLLSRPTYGMSQVDQLLHLSHGTARRWIDGYSRDDRDYAPVVRVAPTGDDLVTWGEFVEASLLAQFRDSGVSIRKLRPVVDQLRAQYKTPYPLATLRPFRQGKEMVMEIQKEIGLERELLLVEIRTGQLMLTPKAQRFHDAVVWETKKKVASGLRLDPSAKLVSVDPLIAFGQPAVRAVKTEILASAFRAGDSVSALAAGFDLREDQVNDAIRYELGKAA